MGNLKRKNATRKRLVAPFTRRLNEGSLDTQSISCNMAMLMFLGKTILLKSSPLNISLFLDLQRTKCTSNGSSK